MKRPGRMRNRSLMWTVKYLVFNIKYIPATLFFQELLFSRELPATALVGVLAAGQAGLWIYDNAYEYTQVHIWSRMRGRLLRQGEL